MNNNLNLSIKEFNQTLHQRIMKAEKKALENVGR
jgi:hypothetical protein